MGGKVSKFGIFSPAVIGAKVALGESRLNKLRGKVPNTSVVYSILILPYCHCRTVSGLFNCWRNAERRVETVGALF